MTKEAKLTAAIRILPEWKGYDEEIRRLQKKIDSGVLDQEASDPVSTSQGKRRIIYFKYMHNFFFYFRCGRCPY